MKAECKFYKLQYYTYNKIARVVPLILSLFAQPVVQPVHQPAAGDPFNWYHWITGCMLYHLKAIRVLTIIAQILTDSWNGHSQQQSMPTNGSGVDDQFSDPAIVSGCLSSDGSGSPPGVQPHWLKSIQQLTEVESSPVKQPSSTQPIHSMSNMPLMYGRQPATHSRMPFAQNSSVQMPPGENIGCSV